MSKINTKSDFESWKKLNSKFTSHDYIYQIFRNEGVSSDLFVAILNLVNPRFLEVDGLVFIKDVFDPEEYESIESNQEFWMNLVLFEEFFDSISQDNLSFLSHTLTALWSKKLVEKFPEKEFKVQLIDDENDGLCITFYQPMRHL